MDPKKPPDNFSRDHDVSSPGSQVLNRLQTAALEAMANAIVLTNPDGCISWVNSAFTKLTGYSRKEVVGQNPRMLGSGWQDVAFYRDMWDTVLSGNVWHGEIVNKHKDGNLYTEEMTITPVRDEAGVITHFIAIKEDITARRQVERELQRIQIALDYTSDAIVIVEWDGNVTYVNESFHDLLEYTKDEITAHTWKSIFVDTTVAEKVLQTVLHGNTWRGEVELTAKRSGRFPGEVCATAVLDDSGKCTGLLLSLSDITDRKVAQERERRATEKLDQYAHELELNNELMEAAKRQAVAASHSKSEFLANMSHEIRTPMTAILGYTETLLDPDLSDSDKLSAIHTVRRNGDHLLQIINDILDISKIEADKLEVERIRCSPIQVVNEVQSLMQVRADAKKLPFNIEFIGAVPETIESDPTRLKQILVNLVGNAIKFTETGGVRLVTRFVSTSGGQCPPYADGINVETSKHRNAEMKDEEKEEEAGDERAILVQHEPMMQFDVLDTGLGMTEEQVGKLFQAFSQADTSTTRKFGGTGLGLMISKRLSEMLGGNITIESQPGEGSLFRVTVTTGSLDGVKMLDDPAMAAISQPEETSVGGSVARLDCRILFAEDGPDNQRLIGHILKKVGADITIVENGKLAVDAALVARDSGSPFDVILMDMQMPVMDGYEATGQLRQKGYTGPIIALTAHAMASDRQKCIDAGCDDYATKPIDRKKLIEMIRKYLTAIGTTIETSEPTEDMTAASHESNSSVIEACEATACPMSEDGLIVSDHANDPDMVELIEQFVGRLSNRIADLEEAFAKQDARMLGELAHKLKGAAGGYGFPSISSAAGQLEKTAKSQKDLDSLNAELTSLVDLCRRAQLMSVEQ